MCWVLTDKLRGVRYIDSSVATPTIYSRYANMFVLIYCANN